jgi:hypothetical protein
MDSGLASRHARGGRPNVPSRASASTHPPGVAQPSLSSLHTGRLHAHRMACDSTCQSREPNILVAARRGWTRTARWQRVDLKAKPLVVVLLCAPCPVLT